MCAVQAPLKERYRKDPGAARVTRPAAVVVSHGTTPAG
jgi:hypothetical protein